MTSLLLRTLFSYKPRLPRTKFWWLCIGLWAAFAVLFVFLESSLGRFSTYVLYPPFIWILGALLVQRLHDRGHSATRFLLLFLPVLGPLWLFIGLGFRKGTEGDNQYGPDPLLVDVDYLGVQM